MIVLGVAMFLYKDSGQSKKSDTDSLIGMGEILLVYGIETFHSELIDGNQLVFIKWLCYTIRSQLYFRWNLFNEISMIYRFQ